MVGRKTAAVVIVAVNLPWIAAWWLVSSKLEPNPANVPALLLLLLLGATACILCAFLLTPEFARRRWLLLAMLLGINLFWLFRWIDAYSLAALDPHGYARSRRAILLLIFTSSAVIYLAYALIDYALNRARRRG